MIIEIGLIVLAIAAPVVWMIWTAIWAFRHAEPASQCAMCEGSGRRVYVTQGGRESTFRCEVCRGAGDVAKRSR